MSPGKVWLLLIPLFNLVWQFVVVSNIAKSLRNEFDRRNVLVPEREPGKVVGMAMSILTALGIVPVVGQVAEVIGVICWVVYWTKIKKYSRLLTPIAVE